MSNDSLSGWYNGFNRKERGKGARWAKKHCARELDRCECCGQMEGRIELHAEDYGEPFTVATMGAYVLCMWCHRMLHMRYRYPEGWQRYLNALRTGFTFEACDISKQGMLWQFAGGASAYGKPGPLRVGLLFDRMRLANAKDEMPEYIRARIAEALDF